VSLQQEAQLIIAGLRLESHPEGGYFRETYRSNEIIPEESLPVRFAGGCRSLSTAIYFLLAGEEYSALHRIKSDEIWHYHAGGTLVIHVLDTDGRYSCHKLGSNFREGASFQVIVRAGSWFGASLDTPDSFVLAGCTVSPGFDFRDFEMANRAELLRLYPEHGVIIERLTR